MDVIGRSTSPRRLGIFRKRDDGQAAFEFLLVLPFFFLFILLLVDLGVMMYQYVSVSNAVREGARYAAVNCADGDCSAADVQDRTLDRSGGILSDGTEVTVAWFDNNGDGDAYGKGDSAVVSVNHPYDFLFFPLSIDVRSCADMRLEQRDGNSGLPSGSEC